VSRRKRVLVYAQHLSGVGHHVRTREIARALARDHRVCLVQGGRPVPRPDAGGGFEVVELPAILRGPEGLEPLDGSRSIDAVLRARAAILGSVAMELAPDVLIVEHYPFSKWELESEIEALIGAARAATPELELVCSVRDILTRTRHEPATAEAHRRRVVSRLNAGFDALLVHSDPRFMRLEEHFAGAGDLEIPVTHTGFVSEKPVPESQGRREQTASGPAGGPWVVVSTGGGAGSAALVGRLVEAWDRLVSRGADAGRRLRIFRGLFWSEEEAEDLHRRVDGRRCVVGPFAGDFLRWIGQADLSISRAGYNTCANLLETRCRALLLPDPQMSDQPLRARRFAEHGLAEVVASGEPCVAELAEAIERALHRERPSHAFDLDGALRTSALLSR